MSALPPKSGHVQQLPCWLSHSIARVAAAFGFLILIRVFGKAAPKIADLVVQRSPRYGTKRNELSASSTNNRLSEFDHNDFAVSALCAFKSPFVTTLSYCRLYF
jgi:hypothetical protein